MTPDRVARKRRRVRLLQRYLLNPPVWALARVAVLPGYALIETRGRVTGKRRGTVVGAHLEGDTAWIVAEHGRHAGYVRNLEEDPEVRLRLRGRWRLGRAVTLPGDDAVARLEQFGRRSHAAAVRRFGTDLLTVRVDLRPPDG